MELEAAKKAAVALNPGALNIAPADGPFRFFIETGDHVLAATKKEVVAQNIITMHNALWRLHLLDEKRNRTMSDEPNKTDRQDAQAPADDQTRKHLAWTAQQAANRALAGYGKLKAPRGYEQSEDQIDLMKALVKAQADFKVPKKTKTAEVKKNGQLLYTYSYADLGGIREACWGSLTKHGLVLIQPIQEEGEDLFLVTKLIHAESGQWMSTRLPLGFAKADPQVIGSSLTYMRRYGLSSLLGIATEDDDDGSREASLAGDQRHTQPHQPDLPGRYQYRYDDEIIWQIGPPLETKRVAGMATEELGQAERRILKRGKHFKQAGDAAKVADARRDLDLVRTALKALNDPDFDERPKDAGTTSGDVQTPPKGETEDRIHGLSEPDGMGDSDPSGEEGPPEEVAGMAEGENQNEQTAPADDQAPSDSEQEGAVGDDGNSGPSEDEGPAGDGEPDDQGGMVGGSDQGEPAPDGEGAASDDDVPSASDEPDGAAGTEAQEPSGGQPGRDPGTEHPPEGRRERPADDPRRDEAIPDEPASLQLNDRYKVNALKPVGEFEQTYLRELNDGEIQGTMLAHPELFNGVADKLKAFREAMPKEDQPDPLTSDWIVDVWLAYWETDKSLRKDVRKLGKIMVAHYDLKSRHAQRRAERLGPEGVKKEQDALDALKKTFDGKSVKK